MQVLPSLESQVHNCVHPLMNLHRLGPSCISYSVFSLFLSWDGLMMIFHDIRLFCGALKIDCFATFVAS